MNQEFKFITVYANEPITITETIKGPDEGCIWRGAMAYGRMIQALTRKSIRVEAVI